MPSMFSTHTNEVEIIIGLLMTCWKMVTLRGLCLHFPRSLWALNLSAVSYATNWASLCFWSELPAIACLVQTFPCLMFSQAAVIGLIHKHSPLPCLYCGSRYGSWPHLTHVMLRVGLSLSSRSQSVLSVPPAPSPRQRKCRFVGCQEAVLIQMTGNPNGKASSNPEFYFSAFPLPAHTHLVWAATWMLAKLISSLNACYWSPFLSFKTKEPPNTRKPLNYLSERQE